MEQNQQFNPNTSVIGFVEAIKICFNKYADFSGRATCAEYWWFFLFQFLVGCVLGWIPFLGWAINVAIFIPFLAVSWRLCTTSARAEDGGSSTSCLSQV